MNVQEAVNNTAVSLGRKYLLVDQDDIVQELWVWLSGHLRKLSDWQVDEHGEAKLRKALRRVGSRYAQREQEARLQLGVGGDTGETY